VTPLEQLLQHVLELAWSELKSAECGLNAVGLSEPGLAGMESADCDQGAG
jgi:hypothetical protein